MRYTMLLVVVLDIAAGGCFKAAGEGPTVVVTASYPGANAQTVVDTIAAPIEQQINGVESMVRLCSESRNDGTYVARVQFKPNVDENLIQVLVQNRVSLAHEILPDAAKRAGVTVKVQAAVQGEKRVAIALLDRGELGPDARRRFSEAVVKRLSAEGAILNPEVFPGPDEKQIYLDIDRTKCAQLGIDITSVFDTLQTAMQDKKLGSQTVPYGRTIQLSADGRKNVDTLKKVTVRTQDGNAIPLSALAEFRLVDGPAAVYRVDLYPAVRITGSPPEGKSAQAAASRCAELANAEQQSQKDSAGFTVINLSAP